MKSFYETPEMEIINLSESDIITSSIPQPGDEVEVNE